MHGEVSDGHLRCCSILLDMLDTHHTSLLCCAFVCFTSCQEAPQTLLGLHEPQAFYSVRVLPDVNLFLYINRMELGSKSKASTWNEL